MGDGVRVHRGARATEAALVSEVVEQVAPLREVRRFGGPTPFLAQLFAEPVRVVVPSRSLREHLAARLARALGGATAGVVVQTLRGLAFEVVGRAGETARGGHVLFPVVVRQLASAEPVLHAALDDLDDGYAAVAASVSDLLDAGYEPALQEGLLDCLAELRGARGERARALVRVAGRASAHLEAYGLEHRADLFRRAREALEADPGRLRARAVLIHGYADATGVQLELLRALRLLRGARVWLDHPDDPAEPGRTDPAQAFTERLVAQLGDGRAEPEAGEVASPAAIELFRAAGAQAEAREVAERVRTALDEGTPPEAMAIVARDLEAYRLALEVQLGRLAVPFSGGYGSLAPPGRRIRALLDLLRDGADTPADRWLDAAALFPPVTLRDLRLALHAIGLGRVRDVAATDARSAVGADGYRLPVRRGLLTPDDGGEEDDDAESEREPATAIAMRRRLELRDLARATGKAAVFCAELERLQAAGTLGEVLAGVRRLLNNALGWQPATVGFAETQGALAALAEELGSAVALSFAEARLLLESALADAGRSPLGGNGGGVAILSVVEARARTFERLFVLGLNRDLFPRPIAEDPLLPDADRARLAAVLPDVPIKRRAFTEERYLFAQLCSAAPRVCISWQAVSDDGKERLASPLVERLLAAQGGVEPPLAAGVVERAVSGPRPAHEHAVVAGIAGDRARLERLLAVSLAGGKPDAAATARARARVAAVRELDEAGHRGLDLGPYFGFVGATLDPADPRRGPLWVTALEGGAYCGWQTFLRRVLRIEPVPDARDVLPRVDRRLLGQVLHSALEEMARAGGLPVRVSLEEALAEGARDLPWPEPAELDAIALRAAEAVAREEGIALAGFARVLGRRVLPYLERVRVLDWPEGMLRGAIGMELEGRIALAGGRSLSFRADRVDRLGGALRLTDYKTGKTFTDAGNLPQRQAMLAKQVALGTLLQGVAYARVEGAAEPALGRYLFVRPDLDAKAAEITVDAAAEPARARFDAAARALADAYERGSFGPRLLDANLADERKLCDLCELSAACVQGESGARRRLLRWIEARSADAAPSGDAAGDALLAVMRLGSEPEAEE
ncbi:MAG TPA: PD-(D/E)XK nuclease family protein [Myxococcota bacterium]|nr:PD-(D/E)XK nuclease family protein [Myxococcota bacterium]